MVLAEARPTVRRGRRSEKSQVSPQPARRLVAARPRRPTSTADGVRVPAARCSSAKKPSLGRLMFAAAIVTALLLGNIGLRATVMRYGYTLSKSEETLAATQTEYDRLSLAIANLQSLERVEEAARTRLGMVDPTSAEFMVLAPGSLRPAGHTATEGAPSPGPSRLERSFATRAGGVLIGLVSPFVARWFYDVPSQDHPRVRVATR